MLLSQFCFSLYTTILLNFSFSLCYELLDYRLAKGIQNKAIVEKPCYTSGLMCKDCKTIVRCKESEAGFTKEPIGTCNTDETCNNGACSNASNPLCRNGCDEFKCTSSGVFPDPGDCQVYYMCIVTSSAPQQFSQICPGSKGYAYGFNPRSCSCDIRLTNGRCPTTPPVPICTKLGQTGRLAQDSRRYYICKEGTSSSGGGYCLYPEQYICENGKTYNPLTMNCI